MRSRFVFIVGLFVLATSGCFFHGGYPNGYYGPGPSVVPQQPSTGFPSGPMYPSPIYQPGGSYPAPINGGVPYVPGNSPGSGSPTPIFTPTNPGPTPTYNDNPGNNGSAPPFNPDNPSGGRRVPDPADEPGFDRNTRRPQLTPTSSTMEPDDETPFSQKESRRTPGSDSDSGDSFAESEDEFHRPTVRQTAGSDDGEVDFANVPTASSKVAPKLYGHHPEFEWVQGTVTYDKPTKTWAIIYDDKPQLSDPLGGDLTLANDPSLARLRDGDAVRIYGSLDQTEPDSRGKPIFRIERFKRL